MPIIQDIMQWLPRQDVPDIESKETVSNGKVGIELEMEGVPGRIWRETRCVGWNFVEDGSLRGGGVEAVLKKPMGGEKLVKALDNFTKWNKAHATTAEVNDRTGMHVHVDIRDLTPRQLKTFLLTSIIFEDVFIEATGGRSDNIFCCRFATSDAQLRFVSKIGQLNNDNCERMMQGVEKYATVNLRSISEKGSVEFRYHRGTLDKDEILSWVNTLLSMKEYAKRNEIVPEEMPTLYSSCGGKEFLARVLSDTTGELAGKYYDVPDAEEKLRGGMRLAQDAVLINELEAQQDNIHYAMSKDNFSNPLLEVFVKGMMKPKRKKAGMRLGEAILADRMREQGNGRVVFDEYAMPVQAAPVPVQGGLIRDNRG